MPLFVLVDSWSRVDHGRCSALILLSPEFVRALGRLWEPFSFAFCLFRWGACLPTDTTASPWFSLGLRSAADQSAFLDPHQTKAGRKRFVRSSLRSVGIY